MGVGDRREITVKVNDETVPKAQQLIIMSPSGVQKERMEAEDMYVLAPDGSYLFIPSPKPWPHKPPKCSDCAPLFLKAYDMRNVGAVIHSHGRESCIVTMINPSAKEFHITHMEMIKGIQGHGYYDELVVPIIENSAHERDLTNALAEAVEAYPKATAVLVRNHGIYILGDSWISAKIQAECYHYLFDAVIKLHQLGLDWSTPDHGPIQKVNETRPNVSTGDRSGDAQPTPRCILLDIEGTTTPISFVSDRLFSYVRENVRRHLLATYHTDETRKDIDLLRSQIKDDLAQGVAGAIPVPSSDSGEEEVIAALVSNVEAMIKADRKITALKQLQGHIWRTGFEKRELEGVVYEDVPKALEKWHAAGTKVYIYSSGSRLAQRLLFGNTAYRDLRQYISGYLDTNVGHKRQSQSYVEICKSVGADAPAQILFLNDVHEEAVAAKAAGLEAIISVRQNHGFETVRTFVDTSKLP